jgi:GT2 family glycosyltransferase
MSQLSFTSLIVTYNSAGEIFHLLDDLRSFMPDNKIIVIDNASRDGTLDVVQEHFPRVQLIQNARNVGYARAVNQGFALCHTEYVLLLNPCNSRTTLKSPVSTSPGPIRHWMPLRCTYPI